MYDSLVFAVDLEVAAEVTVAGRVWHRRPEFHITTLTPDDLGEDAGVKASVLAAAGERLRAELTVSRPFRFDGRVSRVRAPDGRETLVAFCDVEGLAEVYGRLSELVGRTLPLPPLHVTMFTREPGMRGIGLASERRVRAMAQALAGEQARVVLGACRGRTAGA